MSCDYKCIVKIGSHGVPLASCPKTTAGWVTKDADVSAADHEAVVKSPIVPSVTFDIDIPSNYNLGSYCQGGVHVVTKDSSIHLTSAVRKVMEIGTVLKK